MTVMQFSRKYGVDNTTVRQASFNTKKRKERPYSLDFPEEELIAAVKDELIHRIEFYKGKMEANVERLKRVEEGQNAEAGSKS